MGGLIITLNKHDIARIKSQEDEISFKIIRLGENAVDLRIIAPKKYRITRDSYKKDKKGEKKDE